MMLTRFARPRAIMTPRRTGDAMLNGIRTGLFVLVLVMMGFRQPLAGQQRTARDANVQTLVSRLELGRYKSTIEGLSQFGDRRQGTRRNRDAVEWIEAQLKL